MVLLECQCISISIIHRAKKACLQLTWHALVTDKAGKIQLLSMHFLVICHRKLKYWDSLLAFYQLVVATSPPFRTQQLTIAVQPLLSLDLVDTSWQSSAHEGDDSLHALRASNNSLYPNAADRCSNVRPLYPEADALLHAISDIVCDTPPLLLLILLRFLYLQVKNSYNYTM